MKRSSSLWWVLLILIGVAVVVSLGKPRTTASAISINTFMQYVAKGQVKEVRLSSQGDIVSIQGTNKDKTSFELTTLKGDASINPQALVKAGIEVYLQPVSTFRWESLLLPIGVVVLLGVALFYFSRGNRGSSDGGVAQFGKSKAHLMAEGSVKTTFSDVAGCDEAKMELAEIVDFLKHPENFHALGARIPHGVLLVGPPGSGKTLLAKAVAGEAKVPFFSISGSDFVEMFVGVGAARVRDLFEQAKKAAPCIVFIDEIDAVGRRRGLNVGGGNDEREQTLNQLLVEMDGFETKHDIIILAATNRADVLDPALLRPGRFDRQVVVDAPDVKGREQILRIHARKKPLDPSVDLPLVAARTPGMVGADLENLLNEAALVAARAKRKRIIMSDLDEAADRVVMGPERKSRVISEQDKKVTAYHEVGHALAAELLPKSDRVHKLTIVPRGRAAGYMMPLPEDRMHYTEQVLLDRIGVALAGHAAESLIFNETTTGASSDFRQATHIARRMITEWGMSVELGKVAHQQQQDGYSERQAYSEHTAQVIDQEIKRILDHQYQRVSQLLAEHLHQMHWVVGTLMVRETLSGDEFRTLIGGGSLPEPTPEPEPSGVPTLQTGGI